MKRHFFIKNKFYFLLLIVFLQTNGTVVQASEQENVEERRVIEFDILPPSICVINKVAVLGLLLCIVGLTSASLIKLSPPTQSFATNAFGAWILIVCMLGSVGAGRYSLIKIKRNLASNDSCFNWKEFMLALGIGGLVMGSILYVVSEVMPQNKDDDLVDYALSQSGGLALGYSVGYGILGMAPKIIEKAPIKEIVKKGFEEAVLGAGVGASIGFVTGATIFAVDSALEGDDTQAFVDAIVGSMSGMVSGMLGGGITELGILLVKGEKENKQKIVLRTILDGALYGSLLGGYVGTKIGVGV